MSPDLSIVFYTAHRISERFAASVRAELVKANGGRYPIVCVSREPMVVSDFGGMPFTACVVGDVYGPPSIYGVYRQVLRGATISDTPYVAMAEDDSLVTAEHLSFRPPRDNAFYYNRHRWVLTRKLADDKRSRIAFYYWRRRTQLAMLVCSRDLLIETLEERFAKYPEPIPDDVAKREAWGEPGRYERRLGLPARTRAYFETETPCVTVNHSCSLMGRRAVQPTDRIVDTLPLWGEANTLWDRLCVG